MPSTCLSPAQKQFLKQQADYVYNIPKWAHEILKFDCDKWQEEAFDELVKKRFCLWHTGTGVGKSAALSIATLHFLSTRPFPKVPSTAPTQHQLFDILWAEHAKWLRRSDLLSKMFKWTQTKISLKGHEEEWYAVARTSRPSPGEQHSEGLQGFHSGHILFLVDEASAVPDPVFAAVDGGFTTPEAYGILAGNPTRRSGYFFKELSDPHTSYCVRRVNANNAAQVTKESIARIIRKYGEDSDFYRVKVLGLPPLADFASLISAEQVFAMHDRVSAQSENDKVVMSCDVARYGDDATVFFIRKGNTIVERMQIRGMDTMQVAKIGLDLFAAYDPDVYLIDVIGIGSGVVDRTRQVLKDKKSRVVGVNVAEKAMDPEQFINQRAEMFWHLRTRIETISMPQETPLLDEELPEINYSAIKKIQIENKETLKAVIGRSPNDADALALLFYDEVLLRKRFVSTDGLKMGRREHTQAAHGFSPNPESWADRLQREQEEGFSHASNTDFGSSRYRQISSSNISSFLSRH